MKIKRKGAYAHETPLENINTMERPWYSNHSALVVPKAAEAALVHGQDIRDFITTNNDIFDFMLRTKVGRSDNLMLADMVGNAHELQRITRYYISNDGGSLTKVSPPAKGHVVGSWKRATKLTDDFYNSIIKELGGRYYNHYKYNLDANGLPWDERINTKNRSKYETRHTRLNVGWLVSPCNGINDADRSNINFDYYIAETEKLVKPLRDK